MMEKVYEEGFPKIYISDTEATKICKLGQGKDCCTFLVLGRNGFECARADYRLSNEIIKSLEAGTINAKGLGNWEGCFWY